MINLHYDIITVSPMKGGGYGAAMMQKRIKNRLEQEKNAQDPRQELKNYLDSPLEDTSDQIKWWGVCYIFICFFFSDINIIN